MNQDEVLDAAERWFDREDTPNLYEGAQILARLMGWTNSISDGWQYWPKPKRAAAKLMATLESKRRERFDGPDDISAAELTKLVSPIKAMLTRAGADHSVLAPPPPISMPTIDQVITLWDQVRVSADVLKGIDNGGTWGSFTCSEIEALAAIFRAADRGDVADFILAEHAEGDDDEDDLHAHLVNPDK
ncbi:hypothetical protein WILDE_87 [Arthrobacter phage Wilde]|uniref:Uncharacterized protein n=1 Tax=Arthrobacter phage Wilde TaxID=1772323 RepID=A0A0U4JFB7_9CAUD|nr:hypothetical protein WILDE_87 [Arthrobacter phage Wilde]